MPNKKFKPSMIPIYVILAIAIITVAFLIVGGAYLWHYSLITKIDTLEQNQTALKLEIEKMQPKTTEDAVVEEEEEVEYVYYGDGITYDNYEYHVATVKGGEDSGSQVLLRINNKTQKEEVLVELPVPSAEKYPGPGGYGGYLSETYVNPPFVYFSVSTDSDAWYKNAFVYNLSTKKITETSEIINPHHDGKYSDDGRYYIYRGGSIYSGEESVKVFDAKKNEIKIIYEFNKGYTFYHKYTTGLPGAISDNEFEINWNYVNFKIYKVAEDCCYPLEAGEQMCHCDNELIGTERIKFK